MRANCLGAERRVFGKAFGKAFEQTQAEIVERNAPRGEVLAKPKPLRESAATWRGLGGEVLA